MSNEYIQFFSIPTLFSQFLLSHLNSSSVFSESIVILIMSNDTNIFLFWVFSDIFQKFGYKWVIVDFQVIKIKIALSRQFIPIFMKLSPMHFDLRGIKMHGGSLEA